MHSTSTAKTSCPVWFVRRICRAYLEYSYVTYASSAHRIINASMLLRRICCAITPDKINSIVISVETETTQSTSNAKHGVFYFCCVEYVLHNLALGRKCLCLWHCSKYTFFFLRSNCTCVKVDNQWQIPIHSALSPVQLSMSATNRHDRQQFSPQLSRRLVTFTSLQIANLRILYVVQCSAAPHRRNNFILCLCVCVCMDALQKVHCIIWACIVCTKYRFHT